MARLGDTIVIGDLNVTGDINAGGKFGITGLLNLFYPVGSYYETSDVNFDPNVSWGGTWVQDTVGLTTIAADTVGDTDLSKTNNRVRISLGEILGEKNHTLSVNEMPAHTHTFKGNVTSSAGGHTHTLNNHTHTYTKANGATEGHKLTIAEMPKHSHQTYMSSVSVNVGSGAGYLIKYLGTPKDNVTETGGNGSHSHTIKASSANTGANNGNTSSNGAHTHTISGTNSNSGGDGAHNNVQPSIGVVRWHRIA